MTSRVVLVFLLFILALERDQYLVAQGSIVNCIDKMKALPLQRCVAGTPAERGAQLSSTRAYSLAELVSVAEEANPTTRATWERAVARAATLGVERSALFPALTLIAATGDLRAINPFPKPLAPRGYTVVEIPSVEPRLELSYVVLDFGLRRARVDEARFEALAATAEFVRENQSVAFQVTQAFFRVEAAEELLEAAEQSLRTATATQQAAEAQLRAGRATLPDVLQARAEAAQAEYKLQSAEGEISLAKISLTKAIGAEPSPNLLIDRMDDNSFRNEVVEPSEALLERAVIARPDLRAEVERLRGSEARVRQARSAYLPQVTLQAAGAQTAEWPTADYGELGGANVSTWNVSVRLRWDIFDGGRRRSTVAQDRAVARGQAATVREKRDAIEGEVWAAYFGLLTAVKQRRAALRLLEAAQSSYDASLEAFQFGVKDLIDVVTAERSLADARSTQATARANVLTAAAQLEFSTGDSVPGSGVTVRTSTTGEKR